MKIFNKENDREKVYVQLYDIMELIQLSNSIPASIIDKTVGKKMLIVNNDNGNDFIEFDDPIEIEFFKSVEWIIDFKKFRDLTPEELKLLIEESVKDANEITEEYNNYSDDEKLKDLDLHNRYNVIRLKNEDLKKLYFMKEGKYQPSFPLVPDSDGFSLGNDDPSNPYKISVSLDPTKYLFYRTDGKQLKSDENIPENFIQTGLCLAFMNRNDIPSSGNCEISYDFSPDNKYLIINTRISEQKKSNQVLNEEKKGFKKLLNKLFKGKKKS